MEKITSKEDRTLVNYGYFAYGVLNNLKYLSYLVMMLQDISVQGMRRP